MHAEVLFGMHDPQQAVISISTLLQYRYIVYSNLSNVCGDGARHPRLAFTLCVGVLPGYLPYFVDRSSLAVE